MTTAPNAPTNVLAGQIVGEMWVVWDAPSSNGGAPILGYEVTSLTGDICNTVGRDPIVLEFDPIDEACRMGFIGEGTHSFTVVAINALGSGPSSAASLPVTTISQPGPPRNVEGFSEDGQAKVAWWGPTGASCCTTPTGFTVTASPGGATCTAPWDSVGECTVTGLTNGVSYTLTVVTNGDSWVGDAVSVVVVPGTPSVPGAVTNFEFTSGETESDGTVWANCIRFDDPTDNGGSSITGYYLNQVIDGVSQNNNWFIYQGGQCSTATQYGNVGQTLRYSIAAVNAAGTGLTTLSDEVTIVEGNSP